MDHLSRVAAVSPPSSQTPQHSLPPGVADDFGTERRINQPSLADHGCGQAFDEEKHLPHGPVAVRLGQVDCSDPHLAELVGEVVALLAGHVLGALLLFALGVVVSLPPVGVRGVLIGARQSVDALAGVESLGPFLVEARDRDGRGGSRRHFPQRASTEHLKLALERAVDGLHPNGLLVLGEIFSNLRSAFLRRLREGVAPRQPRSRR
jgi:hypothetical protein